MQWLPSEIRDAKYHWVEIIRGPSGVKLEEALAFQKNYAQVVCSASKATFQDNDVSTSNVLNFL